MLIQIDNQNVINLEQAISLKVQKLKKSYGVLCIMLDKRYVLKAYETEKEAEEALEKILRQYDRGQRVIKISNC